MSAACPELRPRAPANSCVCVHALTLRWRQNSSIRDLKAEIGKLFGVRPQSLAIAHVDDSKFRDVYKVPQVLAPCRMCLNLRSRRVSRLRDVIAKRSV